MRVYCYPQRKGEIRQFFKENLTKEEGMKRGFGFEDSFICVVPSWISRSSLFFFAWVPLFLRICCSLDHMWIKQTIITMKSEVWFLRGYLFLLFHDDCLSLEETLCVAKQRENKKSFSSLEKEFVQERRTASILDSFYRSSYRRSLYRKRR